MLLTKKQKKRLKYLLHELVKLLTAVLTFIKLLREALGF